MTYKQQLESSNDIVTGTYNKCPLIKLNGSVKLHNVIVTDIANIGSGTVEASVGDEDAKTYNKEAIFRYLNFCCFNK